jgi:cyclopropane fatty-acyl-phospholipid synthase-like methyltransferase
MKSSPTKPARVPARIAAAIELLTMQPSDHVLEIGCGNGTAAALVCERLIDGKVAGIDRSETQIRLARQRNRACISSGKATFHVMSLEDATLDGAQFDVIFAINVNAFWLRHERPLAAVKRLLKPAGAFYVFYEHPATAQTRDVSQALRENLMQAGFTIEQESSARVYGLKSALAPAWQRK